MTEDVRQEEQEDNAFRFEVKEHIAVLSTNKNNWTKQVNILSFNGKKPMLDIRKWTPGGRISKGIALTKEEALVLKEVLNHMNLEEM